MLSRLMQNEFLSYYEITSSNVRVDAAVTCMRDFDLKDMTSPIEVFSFGEGVFSLKDNNGQLEVIHYEDFIDQCRKPVSFALGRKRCDYIICSTDASRGNGHVILAELTSALGGERNLSIPIKDSANSQYIGGKFEKVAKQLGDSLRTLMAVPEIRTFFNMMGDRQCVMAYKIEEYTDSQKRMCHPMNRYLQVESAETRGKGAEIEDYVINSYGFTYHRISHDNFYQL